MIVAMLMALAGVPSAEAASHLITGPITTDQDWDVPGDLYYDNQPVLITNGATVTVGEGAIVRLSTSLNIENGATMILQSGAQVDSAALITVESGGTMDLQRGSTLYLIPSIYNGVQINKMDVYGTFTGFGATMYTGNSYPYSPNIAVTIKSTGDLDFQSGALGIEDNPINLVLEGGSGTIDDNVIRGQIQLDVAEYSITGNTFVSSANDDTSLLFTGDIEYTLSSNNFLGGPAEPEWIYCTEECVVIATFNYWTDDFLVGCGGSCIVNVPESFPSGTPYGSQYAVSATAVGSGTVSPALQYVERIANSPSSVQVTVTPDPGYHAVVTVNNNETCGYSGSLAGTTYTTDDILGPCTVTATFLNDLPQITPIDDQRAYRDQNFSLAVQASDLESSTLAYSLLNSPSGMSIGNTTGLITWIPEWQQIGSHTVDVKVMDEGGSYATDAFSVEVNAPPTPAIPMLLLGN
jgi:hypothetical protein